MSLSYNKLKLLINFSKGEAKNHTQNSAHDAIISLVKMLALNLLLSLKRKNQQDS